MKIAFAVASSAASSPVLAGVLRSAIAALASASRTPWPVARYA